MRRTLRGARGLAVALGGKTQQQQKRVQHAPITLKKIRSEHGTTMCGVLARTLRSSNFTSAGVAHRGGGVNRAYAILVVGCAERRRTIARRNQ